MNVFNSSDIRSSDPSDDPDLGSPNQFCNPSGPGIGDGGDPTLPGNQFPNCEPQGNLLIIQDPSQPNETMPNDSLPGGCLIIEFEDPVELVNMGTLDFEEGASITVLDENDEEILSFSSPNENKDNGFWSVNKDPICHKIYPPLGWTEFNSQELRTV